MINVRNVDLCIAFGKRLRKLRRAIPLSQELLANKADVSISQISRIERGLLNPTLSTIYALAEAIEINPELLVCDLLDQPNIHKISVLKIDKRKLDNYK